jgi:hypothetical protein
VRDTGQAVEDDSVTAVECSGLTAPIPQADGSQGGMCTVVTLHKVHCG